jgi:hypothetical protein
MTEPQARLSPRLTSRYAERPLEGST